MKEIDNRKKEHLYWNGLLCCQRCPVTIVEAFQNACMWNQFFQFKVGNLTQTDYEDHRKKKKEAGEAKTLAKN